MELEKNVISKEQIEEWKRIHSHVYKTFVDGEPVIWRRLKRSEYVRLILDTEVEDEEDTIKRKEKLYKRQEEIAKAIILYPDNKEEFIEKSAGAATMLSEECMVHSGFDFVESVEL